MNHKTDLDTKDEEFNIDLGDVPTYHVDSANGSHKGAEARGSSFEDQAGIFNEPEQDGLSRALTSRHITFIGFGGGIGVGLFVGIGQAYAVAGPLGIFLSYAITGTLVWCVIQSIGEIVTKYPVDASFPGYAARFVEPALGFTVGWTYWFNMAISVAVEVTAIAVLIEYWITSVNSAAWIAIGLVFIYCFNFLPVRFYGETEVATACIKVITLVGLLICGLVITCGGAPDRHRRGFEYWRNPAAINEFPPVYGSLGRFLAFFYALTNSAFAYGGTEVIVLAGAEAKNPSQQIPRNVKFFVYRQLVFYVGGALMIGLMLPSNHPDLVNNAGNGNSSPWVIAIKMAKIKALPSIINAAIITSALSAGNTYMYIAARTLRGLALNGSAPKILAKTNKWGVPVYAVAASAPIGLLAFLSVGSGGAAQAFEWLQSLIALNNILNWGMLALVYIRFHRAMKVQDISRETLVWRGILQPYCAWFALVFSMVVCLFKGFPVFLKGKWNGANFVAAYISFVVYLVPYIGYHLFKKSRIVRAADVDLTSNIINPWDISEEPPAKTWYHRWWRAIST